MPSLDSSSVRVAPLVELLDEVNPFVGVRPEHASRPDRYTPPPGTIPMKDLPNQDLESGETVPKTSAMSASASSGPSTVSTMLSASSESERSSSSSAAPRSASVAPRVTCHEELVQKQKAHPEYDDVAGDGKPKKSCCPCGRVKNACCRRCLWLALGSALSTLVTFGVMLILLFTGAKTNDTLVDVKSPSMVDSSGTRVNETKFFWMEFEAGSIDRVKMEFEVERKMVRSALVSAIRGEVCGWAGAEVVDVSSEAALLRLDSVPFSTYVEHATQSGVRAVGALVHLSDPAGRLTLGLSFVPLPKPTEEVAVVAIAQKGLEEFRGLAEHGVKAGVPVVVSGCGAI